jgi:molecular chaperone Hsp33
MTIADTTVRFLFDNTPIRGELTQVEKAFQDILTKHTYPAAVKNLLGEFTAAVAMLSDTIKFEGTLSLQVKGAGQVRTIMAECRDNRALRAIAQYNDDYIEGGALIGEGQLAITIDPDKGNRYQGIVPINDSDMTLASVLEDYFQQSEQIRTKIWLFASETAAAGFMIQAMPKSASESSLHLEDTEDWDRIVHLASTLTTDEALSLASQDVLHRLFHEETVRVYEPRQLEFECTCSEERSANAIVTLGLDQAMEIVHENGLIDIDCQFCHERYVYTEEKVKALFTANDDETVN